MSSDSSSDRSDPGADLLTIGELAQRVGVATSALRYYEEVGLLRPARRHRGRRYYDEGAVDDVGAILLFQDVGFTLAEIGRLASARADRAAHTALLADKLDELGRKADEIAVAREALRHALDCPAPTLAACPNFRRVVHERLALRGSWTRHAAGTGDGGADPEPMPDATLDR
jgi:DNA-binding transcriptional MerR regulator